MPRYNLNNGKLVQFTVEEEAARDAEEKAWADASATRKLNKIKKLRNNRLEQTDWMASSDVTMPDSIKTWRQQLRDLPQNNTTESQYNTLLARDSDKKLTNAIWTKP
jgi:hypothetical protein